MKKKIFQLIPKTMCISFDRSYVVMCNNYLLPHMLMLKIINHAINCCKLKSSITTNARTSGAWRPTTTIGNMVAKAHWLSVVATTSNTITEHTPNTTTIETISTMKIIITTMLIITLKTTITIMPTIMHVSILGLDLFFLVYACNLYTLLMALHL